MRSSPLKCAFVLGTRPEVIKLAPVFMAMRAQPNEFRPWLWVTGQHRELLAQTLDVFGLVPDVDFALMQANQSPTALVGAMLQALDQTIAQQRPDWIVVQGDTSSALAGALAGYYARIAVTHVEAGLRTQDLSAPFPEEGNRQMIARIARLHCAPTTGAARHLLAERITPDHVVQTGNPVVDAIRWVAQQRAELPDLPAGWGTSRRRSVLTTLHRRESFGPTMAGMLHAIRALADDASLGLEFCFPVHPNPNINGMTHDILGGHPHIALLPALRYPELVALLQRSWLVLSDSGGLQEEAPSLHKPVLVLRDVTERPEGVVSGAAELVGTDPQRLIAAVKRLASDSAAYQHMAQAPNPYGDGHAAALILSAMAHASLEPHP